MVEQRDADIEVKGETAPGEEGREQPAGEGARLEEGKQGKQDRKNQKQEVVDRDLGRVEAKEDAGPSKGVEQLDGPEAEAAVAGVRGLGVPDEPGGDGNEDVEGGPHGGVDPVGRGEPGPVEGAVPGLEAGGGERTGERRNAERGSEEAGKSEGAADARRAGHGDEYAGGWLGLQDGRG